VLVSVRNISVQQMSSKRGKKRGSTGDDSKAKKIKLPPLKLQYFKGRARAEPTRLMLADKQVEFEDVRYDFTGDWQNVKPNTPYGQLPVLTVGKDVIPQSSAIERYIATACGMYTDDPLENAKIDSIVEAMKDVTERWNKAFWADEKEKPTKMNQFWADEFDKWTSVFERDFKTVNEGSEYIRSGDLTLADVHFYALYTELQLHNKECLSKYPLLKALFDRIGERPHIKAWVASRPASAW